MGLIDEILVERQIKKPAEAWIRPSQIGATEIASLGMTSEDIADGSVDEDKINTSSLDATKAMAGGSGTLLNVVPDGTFIQLDAGLAGAKKIEIQDQQITADRLGIVAGVGCSGGAGAGLAVNLAAAGGLEISGGQVAVKANAVTAAKLGNTAKTRRVSVPLTILGAGGTRTIRNALMACPVGKTITILRAAIASETVATDANGTIVANLIKWDVDAGPAAEVLVVVAHDIVDAAFTPLTAKTGSDMTVVTAASANVLSEHDELYLEVVVGDEGADDIDVDWIAPVLTLDILEF